MYPDLLCNHRTLLDMMGFGILQFTFQNLITEHCLWRFQTFCMVYIMPYRSDTHQEEGFMGVNVCTMRKTTFLSIALLLLLSPDERFGVYPYSFITWWTLWGYILTPSSPDVRFWVCPYSFTTYWTFQSVSLLLHHLIIVSEHILTPSDEPFGVYPYSFIAPGTFQSI